MTPPFPAVAACILALATISGTARAQEEKNSTPLPSHFPLGVEACFGQVYDARHLRAHPKQRVASFHIFRDFTPDPNLEFEPDSREQLIENDGSNGRVSVTAYVRFRDRKGVFSNGLSCGSGDGGKAFCFIDCDGGSFHLRPSGSSLILDNNGFVVVGGCGASEEEEERTEYVTPGTGDKTFRLDKQPLSQCLALRDAQAPAWAKLGKPLRLRFDKGRATCHARSYDAAHLRAHPQQTVKRIAVLNPRKEPASDTDSDMPNFKFVIRVETKDGQTYEKPINCEPERYTYMCTSPEPAPDGSHFFYLTRAGDDIMLRDRRGVLAPFLGARLGADDHMFKLSLGTEDDCTLQK